MATSKPLSDGIGASQELFTGTTLSERQAYVAKKHEDYFRSRMSSNSSRKPPFSRSPDPGSRLFWDPAIRSLRYEKTAGSQKKRKFEEPGSSGIFGVGGMTPSPFPFQQSQQTPAPLSGDIFDTHRHELNPSSRSAQQSIHEQLEDYLDFQTRDLGRRIKSEVDKHVSSAAFQSQIDAAISRCTLNKPGQSLFGNGNYSLFGTNDLFNNSRQPLVAGNFWVDQDGQRLPGNEKVDRKWIGFGALEEPSKQNPIDVGAKFLDESDFQEDAFVKYKARPQSMIQYQTQYGEEFLQFLSASSSSTTPWTLRSQIGSYPPFPRTGFPETDNIVAIERHTMNWIWTDIQRDGWLKSPIPCSKSSGGEYTAALRTRMDEYYRRLSTLPDCQFTIIENLVLDLQLQLFQLGQFRMISYLNEHTKLEHYREGLKALKKIGIMDHHQGAEALQALREIVTKDQAAYLEGFNKGIMRAIEQSIEKQVEVFVRNEHPAKDVPTALNEDQEVEVDCGTRPCNGRGETATPAEAEVECKGTKTKAGAKSRATKVEKKQPAKTRVTRANKCG